MRRQIAPLSAVLAAAILPFSVTTGTALAAGSPTTSSTAAAPSTATTTASTAAKAPPKPKSGAPPKATPTPSTGVTAKLYIPDAFVVHHDAVTVAGRTLHVEGFVRPYVAGQTVEVKSSLNGKVFKTDRLRIKPSAKGTDGVFIEKVTSAKAGLVRVRVTHLATAQEAGFQVRRAIAALSPTGPGSRSEFVDLIQQRLVALHFYLPLSGVYDLQTNLAVDAYHRLLGRGTSPALDPATLADLLDGKGAFAVRDPHDGKHVEGDLGDQLLALINGTNVYQIYPISSGKPSTPTILGRFQVYMRTPGYLPDGMYFSDFFYGGYAIHGYDPAPDYPASHGCMRLPISDALSVWNWLNYGVTVDVYQ
jgi:lipoprotein-anchoring transpeptidase ErfK/SrfK